MIGSSLFVLRIHVSLVSSICTCPCHCTVFCFCFCFLYCDDNDKDSLASIMALSSLFFCPSFLPHFPFQLLFLPSSSPPPPLHFFFLSFFRSLLLSFFPSWFLLRLVLLSFPLITFIIIIFFFFLWYNDSPDVILSGKLGSKHQLTENCGIMTYGINNMEIE